MLPNFLSSSYQRYKEDTLAFTTWLSKTAKKCGHISQDIKRDSEPKAKPAPTTGAAGGGRLKGKARKEAKKAAETAGASSLNATEKAPDNVKTVKFVVTTKELLAQALAIAQSNKPDIVVPEEIRQVAARAIKARKRCARWFENAEANDQESLVKHGHFIKILEQALEILAPCFLPKEQASGTSVETTTTTAEAEAPNPANRFQGLHVDDAADEEADVTAAEVSESMASNKKAGAKPVSGGAGAVPPDEYDVYELEVDRQLEVTFAIYCFFEDLHEIQNFIKDTWKMYADNKLDYISAAFITNTAIDIVRKQEELIVALDPKYFKDKKGSYHSIAYQVYRHDSILNDWDPEDRAKDEDSLKYSELHEFIYLPMCRVLTKYPPSLDKAAYPRPIPPMRFSYIISPDLLEDPRLQQAEKDDTMLVQLMLDAHLKNDMSQSVSGLRGHRGEQMRGIAEAQGLEDEFLKGVRDAYLHGKVDVWATFACRAILDIQEALGKSITARPYRTLETEGGKALDILDMYVDGNELVPRQERWAERDGRLTLDTWRLLTYGIKAKMLPGLKRSSIEEHKRNPPPSIDDLDPLEKQRIMDKALARMPEDIRLANTTQKNPVHEANYKRLNPQPIEPEDDGEFLFKNDPLYGGTVGLDVRMKMLQCGLTLANHHLSIYGVAHLYNCLLQTVILSDDNRWPLMDRVIQLNTFKLFGSDLPKTAKDCHSRACLKIRFSVRNYASDRSANRMIYRKKQTDAAKKPAWMVMDPFASALFQYSSGDKTLSACVNEIRTLIVQELSARQAASSNGKSKAQQARRSRLNISDLRFLYELRDMIPKTINDAAIDYVNLTRACNKLLRTIHSQISRLLGETHPLVNDGDSNEDGLVVMAIVILSQASDVQFFKEGMPAAMRREAKDLEKLEAPQLMLVGDILKDLLSNGDIERLYF